VDAGREPLHIFISGGAGALAVALGAAFRDTGDRVTAPPRAEMDVRDEAQVEAAFAKLERIDVLVANAGLTRDGAVTALDDAAIGEALDVNLRGAFLCTRAALRLMLRQRSGHIILVGSRAAKHGTRGQSAYAAAKAGLVGLGMSLAREYGPRQIRCNVVLPGFLETKMTAGLSEKRLAQIRDEHALGRFTTVADSARFIAQLARMEHVSGQVFTLDSRLDRWT
jgi:3-oxoacyl-[acyl-carrier protein] reductase